MRMDFCDYHICQILKEYDENQKPLDALVGKYLKAHKSIGAHDRREIGEMVYGMVRWKTLIDCFCEPKNHLNRLRCYRNLDFERVKNNSTLPLAARYGLSEYLYQKFNSIYGAKATEELATTFNLPAPPTIRANLLKISREALLEKLQDKMTAFPCKEALAGICFSKREPLFSLPEFKEGLFEMQDEGSQLIANLVQVKPKEHFLDYCSGSGGKTLAIAPFMKGQGQIYLYDNRPWILIEAKKRLKRAGIQNAQFKLPQNPVDWVLTDVPCSGTGTLRRNPDAKWKINQPFVSELILMQREIVKKAFKHLKPGGMLVYATCSILPEENEEQIDFFQKTLPLSLAQQPLLILPKENGPDGFFAAVFKKENVIGSSSL